VSNFDHTARPECDISLVGQIEWAGMRTASHGEKRMLGIHAEPNNCEDPTILVAADDFGVLALAQAILVRKGNRVLLENDLQAAVRFLAERQVPMHSVAIRAGMRGDEELRKQVSETRGQNMDFHASVDAVCVRLVGLDHPGADWKSAALEAS
jgi:hypothetical protein